MARGGPRWLAVVCRLRLPLGSSYVDEKMVLQKKNHSKSRTLLTLQHTQPQPLLFPSPSPQSTTISPRSHSGNLDATRLAGSKQLWVALVLAVNNNLLEGCQRPYIVHRSNRRHRRQACLTGCAAKQSKQRRSRALTSMSRHDKRKLIVAVSSS